jgi:hypothetical protein
MKASRAEEARKGLRKNFKADSEQDPRQDEIQAWGVPVRAQA